MPYEVTVAGDEERGFLYQRLEDAVRHAESEGGEVWALADDNVNTRMKREYPPPSEDEVYELAEVRAKRNVEEKVGLAEREAAALLSSMPCGSAEELHRIVVVAFLKGWVSGYGEIAGRLDEIADRYQKGEAS